MPDASPRRHLGAEPSTPMCLVPGRLYYDQSFYQEVFNPPIEADEDQDYVSSHPRSHTFAHHSVLMQSRAPRTEP